MRHCDWNIQLLFCLFVFSLRTTCPAVSGSHLFHGVQIIFSTSHVIPHDRALVLIPGVVSLHALQKVISVWYPTEITFCRPTEGYFCRACQVLTLRQVMQPSLSNFVSTYKKKSSNFGDGSARGGDRTHDTPFTRHAL